MCSDEERQKSSDALKAKLAEVEKEKSEATSGESVNEGKLRKAEAQEARLKEELQVYEDLANASDEEKTAGQATAAAYAVLSNEAVEANREDAYVAALACLLSGKMSDLEDVPVPPGPMTKANCEMLRKGE